jgi:hypothetical protein
LQQFISLSLTTIKERGFPIYPNHTKFILSKTKFGNTVGSLYLCHVFSRIRICFTSNPSAPTSTDPKILQQTKIIPTAYQLATYANYTQPLLAALIP